MNYRYQIYLDNLDEEIKNARSNQNALDYFNKSNEAGIEPEDKLLYEQGQVDAGLSQGRLEKVVNKPRKKRKSSKTGISVRLIPRNARAVYDNFSFSKESLKSFIKEYVPRNTRKSVDEMTYRELRRYGYVIFGVAKKELKNSKLDNK